MTWQDALRWARPLPEEDVPVRPVRLAMPSGTRTAAAPYAGDPSRRHAYAACEDDPDWLRKRLRRNWERHPELRKEFLSFEA